MYVQCTVLLQGAKVVGRVAADPSMMADNSSHPFPILTYPPIGNLDPTSSDHHVDTTGEEQLAAGSSLNTHQSTCHQTESSAQNDTRTDLGGGDKENVASSEVEGGQRQQRSPVPPVEGDETQDLLKLPEAGGMMSSGASSATGSLEDLRNVNSVHGSSNVSLDDAELDASVQEVEKNGSEVEIGSVRVTEWNVAHSLKLRDTDALPDGFNKDETSEESDSDQEKRQQLKGTMGEAQSDSSSSKPNSPCEISAGISNVESTLGNGAEGGGVGGAGMEWWAEAMAETQNVTDDIDSLVEQLETDVTGGKSSGGLRDTAPLSLQSQSSSAIHDKPTVKKTSTVSSHSADGALIDLSDIAADHGISRREQNKALGKISAYSSTDSVNLTGRRSKTGESIHIHVQCTICIVQCTMYHVHVLIVQSLYTYMYMYIYNVHVNTCVCSCMYMYIDVHVHVCTCIHVCMLYKL